MDIVLSGTKSSKRHENERHLRYNVNKAVTLNVRSAPLLG